MASTKDALFVALDLNTPGHPLTDAGQSVREVQKLSRHTKLETLMIYDDHRQQHQLKVSSVLADLV